jgi:OOP family OmpA-OmpF porin
MKNLNRLALAILLVFAVVNVNAQDKNNPWQVTIGVNAVDALGTGNQVGNEDIGFSKLYSVSE